MKKTIIAIAAAAMLTACAGESEKVTLLPASNFEKTIDGRQISLYTIKGGDITAQITNYGARVVSLWAPGRDGSYADVATGYENIDRYVDNPGERFLGAIVGPVANRIGNATFDLDGETYNLGANDNGNTLHGGFTGVDRLVWDVVSHSEDSLCLEVVHPDGFEGFPGNTDIKVTYSITADNGLRIDYNVTTDKATPVNVSNHTFFNLTGRSDESILGHEIMIKASLTTPVDERLIPTGEFASVEGTPHDFRTAKAIGKDVSADDEQLRNGNGYDHNWCLDRETESEVELVASLYEPQSGRVMDILTDQPGLQFYCGNFFDGKVADKYGNPIGYRCSLALETQKFPDGINQSAFPETVLRPGEAYTQTCIYKFSTR